MSTQVQVLEIEYGSAQDFAQDYRANLSNGGVFIATERSFALRDFVVVRLRLPWCNRVIDLEGEVVHIVAENMAGMSVKPGVAVQFREPPAGIRGRLGPLCAGQTESAAPKPSTGEDRVAPRKTVRVEAHLDAASGPLRGRTRNVSKSGVLVDVQEGSATTGERVRVNLTHPTGRPGVAIDGVIVRIAKSSGRVSALAVQFDEDQTGRRAVQKFVESLQATDHKRRLGSITGPITELGPQSIVQMLTSTAPRGTIYLRHAQEEGVICFENGVVRLARVGPVTGMKALIRMLRWNEGTFEFHSELDERGGAEPPLPLAAALVEAARNIDESRRADAGAFPLQARLVARHSRDGQFVGVLTKVEEALLDVAQAGFTVQRALEVIPEPDPEIFRALRSLIDAEMIELH